MPWYVHVTAALAQTLLCVWDHRVLACDQMRVCLYHKPPEPVSSLHLTMVTLDEGQREEEWRWCAAIQPESRDCVQVFKLPPAPQPPSPDILPGSKKKPPRTEMAQNRPRLVQSLPGATTLPKVLPGGMALCPVLSSLTGLGEGGIKQTDGGPSGSLIPPANQSSGRHSPLRRAGCLFLYSSSSSASCPPVESREVPATLFIHR